MSHIKQAIPIYKLYGEPLESLLPELLHCELLESRSRCHDWHIKAHQHADITQIIYLHNGQMTVDIEGAERHLTSPSVQVVPMFCVHAFHFEPGADGYVLSLTTPLLTQFQHQFGPLAEVLNTPHCVNVPTQHNEIKTLFRTLHHEHEHHFVARKMMLHSLTTALLVWLNRQGSPPMPGISNKLERKRSAIALFNQLVEKHYREHLSISRYSRQAGISSVHLNTLCHLFYGNSALQVVHQRLVIEARRCLLYSSMTVSQISDYLGFSDAAYFSRFFRRYTGCSPKHFRDQNAKISE